MEIWSREGLFLIKAIKKHLLKGTGLRAFGFLLECLFNHHNNFMLILKIRNQSCQDYKLSAQHCGGEGQTQTHHGGKWTS